MSPYEVLTCRTALSLVWLDWDAQSGHQDTEGPVDRGRWRAVRAVAATSCRTRDPVDTYVSTDRFTAPEAPKRSSESAPLT